MKNQSDWKTAFQGSPPGFNGTRADIHFDGLPVYVDDRACVVHERKQFRFPRSKKRRIRKKWAKQKKNYKTETSYRLFKTPWGLIISSKQYNRVKSEIEANAKNNLEMIPRIGIPIP